MDELLEVERYGPEVDNVEKSVLVQATFDVCV